MPNYIITAVSGRQICGEGDCSDYNGAELVVKTELL